MILCFGEILLRLSAPGRELLFQNNKLIAHIGGAELNVAVGLANLGHATAMASALPDNELGRAALAYARSHGVDCSRVVIRPGRMGLYFLSPGSGLRASNVVYDRVASNFSLVRSDDWDWDGMLAGCGWLHLTGITPALGHESARSAIAAARAAKRGGATVSFDCNYRSHLWAAWHGDPRGVLSEIVAEADIVFGNHRDITLLTGQSFAGDSREARRRASEAAFEAYPRLSRILSTQRVVEDVDRHRFSARVDTPHSGEETQPFVISNIVDRIGAGDAFAAGAIHALKSGLDDAGVIECGLAVAALKHSLPGDASLFRQADVDAFLQGGLDVQR